MARRITKKDVYAVADAIVAESDIIRAIKVDAGNSSYNHSWMFTFYLENSTEYQHSFWDLALMTPKEAHMFLRGMAHMLELQAKAVTYCDHCGAELIREDCPNYGNGPEHA